jgi:hypothetical protein
MVLEDQMQAVLDSYKKRVGEGEQALSKIWNGYGFEEDKLTDQVSAAFRKVLDEIGPVISRFVYENNLNLERATVEEYSVEYKPARNEFKIKIDKINLCISPEDCPHIYLEPITGFGDELHPRIKEFMKEYHVYFISNPENDCHHQ